MNDILWIDVLMEHYNINTNVTKLRDKSTNDSFIRVWSKRSDCENDKANKL